jgi:hypothetical protein
MGLARSKLPNIFFTPGHGRKYSIIATLEDGARLNGRAPARQAQNPEFKPQYYRKIKVKIIIIIITATWK